MSICRFFPSNWALHMPASTVSREICWCFEATDFLVCMQYTVYRQIFNLNKVPVPRDFRSLVLIYVN
jgi:hypothetical protein